MIITPHIDTEQDFQYFPVHETVIMFDKKANSLQDLAYRSTGQSYSMTCYVEEILGIGVEKNYLNIYYKSCKDTSHIDFIRATLNEGVITFY